MGQESVALILALAVCLSVFLSVCLCKYLSVFLFHPCLYAALPVLASLSVSVLLYERERFVSVLYVLYL